MTSKVPAPPVGLGVRGKALWRSVMTEWDPGPTERLLLVECCRTADELDVMRRKLDKDGPTIPGSKGQARQHPLILEVQRHRASLVRLLRALNLEPAEAVAGVPLTVQQLKAQRAAQSRWRREAAKRSGA